MIDIKELFGEGDFFTRNETKEQMAKAILKHNHNSFIDKDGLARCTKCKTPKMYHEVYRFENGKVLNKWLPIVCKCEFEEMERERREKTEKEGCVFVPRKYSDGSKLHTISNTADCPF